MTVTPINYGHFFPTDRFASPVYFEGDDGAAAGGAAPAGDAGAAAEGAAAEAGASTEGEQAPAGTEGAAPAAAGGEQAPVADPDDGTIPEALKPYVHQLREEAASRRTALKPFEDVFGKFAPEESEALLRVIDGLTNEETQHESASLLKEVVEAILGDGTEDPNRPLTKADLDRMDKEKATKAEQEAAVQGVIKEAIDLGYPEGTREHRRLLDLAINETQGDLKKAHEAITAEKEATIAAFVKEVQEGKAKWPTLVAPAGVKPADVSGEPPKTWADARKNAEARRKAAFGS